MRPQQIGELEGQQSVRQSSYYGGNTPSQMNEDTQSQFSQGGLRAVMQPQQFYQRQNSFGTQS